MVCFMSCLYTTIQHTHIALRKYRENKTRKEDFATKPVKKNVVSKLEKKSAFSLKSSEKRPPPPLSVS